jgi:hypothetical protein
LRIAAGTPISIRIDSGASIPKLQNALGQGAAAIAAAANIQAIHASSDGLEVVKDAKPVAHIDQLTVHRGGTVKIDKISLQGEAAEAARSERGFWTLVGGILGPEQHRENPFHTGGGFSTEPVIVPGFVKGALEDKLEAAFIELLKTQGRSLIPGVDLGSVLGVPGGPPAKTQ